MTRNQNKRTEIACPINSTEIKAFLNRYIRRSLADNVNRRIMLSDGEYTMPESKGKESFDVQKYYLNHVIHLEKSRIQNKKIHVSILDKFFKQRKKRK